MMPFLSLNYQLCILTAFMALLAMWLPETMCDGGILFYINRKVQKVFIFAAYLRKANLYAFGVTGLKQSNLWSHVVTSYFKNQQEVSYRFTCKAARLISQSALEDLVDPSGSRGGIAIVVLAVQCAVCKASVGLLLLPLLLKQICNGV